MSLLFKDVLECLNMDSVETKKMVLLYLVIYAKKNPQLTLQALSNLAPVALLIFLISRTSMIPIRSSEPSLSRQWEIFQ